MNRTELALELFNPDENGISRWVSKNECVDKFNPLFPTNGNQWYRNKGLGHLVYEKKEENGITFWRFNGIKKNENPRNIRPEIWEEVRKKPCVITNLRLNNGHKIEVDHKDGRYPIEVGNLDTQKEEYFQPLLESLNKQKRTDCLGCKKTGLRYDARERGYSVSVVKGGLKYDGTCEGCFWFDPTKFKI
jgi:hypothetical protein